MSWPVYCGYDHADNGCVALADVLIESPGRRRLACHRHQPAVEAWARAGGGHVTVTTVTQPAGAVAGTRHDPNTLFDIPGGTP